MRKYAICLLMLAVTMISSAEMIIHTADGREIKVQVNASEIARIEFSNQKTGENISTPAPVSTPEAEKGIATGVWVPVAVENSAATLFKLSGQFVGLFIC